MGKYFDESGRIKDPTPRPVLKLGNWIESLEGTEREDFVAFLRLFMVIYPARRGSARELLLEGGLGM